MVEPIASIAPFIAIPPVQPTQNSTSADAVATNGATAITSNFANAFVQEAAIQTEDALLGIGGTTSQGTAASTSTVSDTASLDSTVLANLSPQALTIISQAISENTSASGVEGVLSTSQLQEIAILENDAQVLNATETAPTNDAYLLEDSASSVSLSSQAVDIINNLEATNISAGGALATAQLQQIAAALAPFANEPLTPATLTQMQNALIAIGLNPNQLSLQNYLLSMNYLAELLPAPLPDAEQQAVNDNLATEVVDT